jgi:hypothetical protein
MWIQQAISVSSGHGLKRSASPRADSGRVAEPGAKERLPSTCAILANQTLANSLAPCMAACHGK